MRRSSNPIRRNIIIIYRMLRRLSVPGTGSQPRRLNSQAGLNRNLFPLSHERIPRKEIRILTTYQRTDTAVLRTGDA